MAQFLIDHGADVNWIIDKKKGLSLLHYFCAVKSKLSPPRKELNLKVIALLVGSGAYPRQRTLSDLTAFDLLEGHCNREAILEILVQAEKDAQIRDRIPKHNVKKLGENYFRDRMSAANK